MPDFDKYISELDYQVKEDGVTLEEGLERAEDVLYNDMTYNWRAFRMAHAHHMDLFDNAEMDLKCPGKSLLQTWRSKKGKVTTEESGTPERENKGHPSIVPKENLIETVLIPLVLIIISVCLIL